MNMFRTALAIGFWITGIAIARCIPGAFRRKQIDGNLFFRRRSGKIIAGVPRAEAQLASSVSTMRADQMLHHLSLASEARGLL